MTTELTKAAQQALKEAHMLILPIPAPEVSALDLAKAVSERATKIATLLTEALTQRPAAQTEREAFEAWFDDYHDKACAEFGGIDCTDPKGIAEDAWQAARAILALRPQAVPMTEAELIACVVKANCLGGVPMTNTNGHYHIDTPSDTVVRLKDAIEAHHGSTHCADGGVSSAIDWTLQTR